MGPNHPCRMEMQKFSVMLRKMGVLKTMPVLPSKIELQTLIARAGLNENLNLKRRTQAPPRQTDGRWRASGARLAPMK